MTAPTPRDRLLSIAQAFAKPGADARVVRDAIWRTIASDLSLLREYISPTRNEVSDALIAEATKIGDVGHQVDAPLAGHAVCAPSPTRTAEVDQAKRAPPAGHLRPAPSAAPPARPSAAELSAAGATLHAAQSPRESRPPVRPMSDGSYITAFMERDLRDALKPQKRKK